MHGVQVLNTYIKIHHKGVLKSGVLALWRTGKDRSLLPRAFTVTGRGGVWRGGTGGGAMPGGGREGEREGELNVSQTQTNPTPIDFSFSINYMTITCSGWGLRTITTLYLQRDVFIKNEREEQREERKERDLERWTRVSLMEVREVKWPRTYPSLLGSSNISKQTVSSVASV